MTRKRQASLEDIRCTAAELFALELHQLLADLIAPKSKNRILVWHRDLKIHRSRPEELQVWVEAISANCALRLAGFCLGNCKGREVCRTEGLTILDATDRPPEIAYLKRPEPRYFQFNLGS